MHATALLQLLILLTLANGTPVVTKKILGQRLAYPLDGGTVFFDGRPLFGPAKTIRGILLALLITGAAAPLIGLDARLGLLVAATAMAGDLFSSFIKRRLNFPPSSRATGLDQIPESLFPLLACRETLSLTLLDIALGTALFLIGEIIASRALYKFGLRDRPY